MRIRMNEAWMTYLADSLKAAVPSQDLRTASVAGFCNGIFSLLKWGAHGKQQIHVALS